MYRDQSPALPIAYVVMRILILLNRLVGAAILALLIATIIAEDWMMTALNNSPSAWIGPLMPGLRAIAVLGLLSIPLNELILRRLIAIVQTVHRRDPFVPVNARRLQSIAWALLGIQILSVVIGAIGEALSTREHPLHLDAGFSASGWLAVLLTFVLARIFAEGTQMREELEGTV